jgi:hypothetical protein
MSLEMVSFAFEQRNISPALKLAYVHVCDTIDAYSTQTLNVYLDELAEFVGVPEATARGLLDEMVWKGFISSWQQSDEQSFQLEIWVEPRRQLVTSPSKRKGISPGLRLKVIHRHGKKCAYCQTTDGPFHIDHIHPVSRGGTNDIDNLTVACAPCNLSKRDHTLEEWGGR